MQIGLVGKPSSGKSSFFKAATLIDVPIADYPFTTIQPNTGIGYVSVDCVCQKFKVNCNPKNSICVDGKRMIPIKIIDVAGLVPDAHLGRGMGNQFLDDLRQADCLIHIVDVSGTTDSEGKPTKDHDPAEDIKFLEKEIDFWFMKIVEKGLEKYRKKKQFSNTDVVEILSEQLSGLGIQRTHIEKCLESFSPDTEEFSSELRKISKPIIIAANKIDLPKSHENFERLKKEFPNLKIIPTSAASEIALNTAKEKGLIEYKENKIKIIGNLDEKQKKGLEFIEKNIIEKYGSTGIKECLNTCVFEILEYIPVYPV
ncbi:MAG: YchF-related putative GTPase, partial [Candidatus Aenigmatarchaeota archaeon]